MTPARRGTVHKGPEVGVTGLHREKPVVKWRTEGGLEADWISTVLWPETLVAEQQESWAQVSTAMPVLHIEPDVLGPAELSFHRHLLRQTWSTGL